MWNACHILRSIEIVVANFPRWVRGRVCVPFVYKSKLLKCLEMALILIQSSGNFAFCYCCCCCFGYIWRRQWQQWWPYVMFMFSSFNTNVGCNTWYQVAIKYYWWDEFVYRIQNEYQQLWVNGIPFNVDIDFMHTHTHTNISIGIDLYFYTTHSAVTEPANILRHVSNVAFMVLPPRYNWTRSFRIL